MENVSKALLMAGGVLIAILIITVAVILFSTYSQLGIKYEEKISENQIKKFNSNFTKFEGRKDITIQEIVTLTNFAKQYEEETEIHIKVNLSSNDLTSKDEGFLIELIRKNLVKPDGTIKYFNCDSENTKYEYGKVNIIEFQPVNL